jgi:hypothetical protein
MLLVWCIPQEPSLPARPQYFGMDRLSITLSVMSVFFCTVAIALFSSQSSALVGPLLSLAAQMSVLISFSKLTLDLESRLLTINAVEESAKNRVRCSNG